ncbi:unnamed protein product [Zymoseptoria tritici ST99CH_1E4]|uniref:Xylanolytic transcriptional activator regulatory domain-containing protein n=1 Tax=Zymoseptoria tritici ST99CH_1E4 TaxID=1276532 RepID=A0A2H1G3I4_ZYMTR|nr:unnamed protein product [Zymoseptoria tritici ST99CH_1E4]
METNSLPLSEPTKSHEENDFGDEAPSAKRQRVSQACGPPSVAIPSGAIRLQQQTAQHSFQSDPTVRRDAAQALSDLGSIQRPVINQQDRKSSNPPSLALTPRSGKRPAESLLPPLFNREWHGGRADGLATIAARHDEDLYGPSSTVAFLRTVMPSQNGTSTPVGRESLDGRRSADFRSRSSAPVPERLPPQTDGGMAVLPMRRQADNFVTCFWEFVHPLFPVLHRPTFQRKYEQLWTDNGPEAHSEETSEAEEAAFNSTLNLVFAVGCKFSSHLDPGQKSSVSDNFYQRSRQAYPFDILDSTSISLVQMLLLMAVYLQSTEYASRCWNSAGLAIRMAQSLGLHVDQIGRKGNTQLEVQMRRRIWHTCIHLDRLLSMTFGRPSIIGHSTSVPIPSMVDDEYLSDRIEATQPKEALSRLGLFTSSCGLFEILDEILDLFYRDRGGNSATQAAELVAPVLNFNRRLDKFAETVPEYLRVQGRESPPSTEDHIQLQQQVLFCRYLYVRLLSLRPLLLMASKREARPPMHNVLGDEVIRACCNSCVSTACRLIDSVYANLGTLYRSSGWHSVYFTFSSAIVLLAYTKIDAYRPEPNVSDMPTAWNRCLAILNFHEDQIPSARNAIQILNTMKAQVLDVQARSRAVSQAPTSANSPYPSLHAALPVDANGLVNGGGLQATDVFGGMNLEDAGFFGNENISEAWYGQQMANLEWLEVGAPFGVGQAQYV